MVCKHLLKATHSSTLINLNICRVIIVDNYVDKVIIYACFFPFHLCILNLGSWSYCEVTPRLTLLIPKSDGETVSLSVVPFWNEIWKGNSIFCLITKLKGMTGTFLSVLNVTCTPQIYSRGFLEDFGSVHEERHLESVLHKNLSWWSNS